MMKIVPEAQALIKRAAESRRQFSARTRVTTRVGQVSTDPINQKLEALTNMVQSMMAGSGGTQQVKACGIYLHHGHPTDMCPTLQDDHAEEVKVAGNF